MTYDQLTQKIKEDMRFMNFDIDAEDFVDAEVSLTNQKNSFLIKIKINK